jgi:large subunit ribosomal protein L6
MSRLGKKPIMIPQGVEIGLKDEILSVKGPLGEISRNFKDDIVISVEKDKITLSPNTAKKARRTKEISALWGTYASHIRNMIEGVSKGFNKVLVIEGIGYRAGKEGSILVLSLGFSHSVKVLIPQGIDLKLEKNTIVISGADKEQVGAFAAQIRGLKKPEPYKGKGIRYQDEIIRRKSGKKAVASTI